MRRTLVVTGFVAAGVLLLVLAAALALGGDALAAAGRKALSPREGLLRTVAQAPDADRLVVFLGDSTMGPPRAVPRRVGGLLRGVEVRSLWAPGLGPAEHYLLLGGVLAHEPDVAVLLAHLRMFRADGPLWAPDLLTLLPPRELPRALALPFHAHGVGAARLTLASLWGAFGSEALLERFVGGRELARGAPVLRWLTPPRRRVRDALDVEPRADGPVRLYGDPLYEGHPDLAMLAASVEQATRRGARALVLVSPVPVHRFRERGTLARADFPGRVARLREVTERHGGELLDLHAALGADAFSDALGHMKARGTRRIAEAILPRLRRMLEPARPARRKAPSG